MDSDFEAPLLPDLPEEPLFQDVVLQPLEEKVAPDPVEERDNSTNKRKLWKRSEKLCVLEVASSYKPWSRPYTKKKEAWSEVAVRLAECTGRKVSWAQCYSQVKWEVNKATVESEFQGLVEGIRVSMVRDSPKPAYMTDNGTGSRRRKRKMKATSFLDDDGDATATATTTQLSPPSPPPPHVSERRLTVATTTTTTSSSSDVVSPSSLLEVVNRSLELNRLTLETNTKEREKDRQMMMDMFHSMMSQHDRQMSQLMGKRA